MRIDRRLFGMGLLGLGLAACSRAVPGGQGAAAPEGLPDDLLPAPNRAYDTWVAAFRGRAEAQGISRATLNTAFRGAGFLPGVVSRDRNQTEFNRTLEDYLAIAASDERVEKGRQAYARHRRTLAAIEDQTGVDAKIVTAIWGLESFYGERQGLIPVISATSTLAFDGRRGRYFERELIAALRIVQNGDIPAARMTGSWAGAMGHTQCMPTVFQDYAVDFTGDGRRDIWSEDPSDALATTAGYLQRHGWTRGLGWGRELVSGTPSGRVIQPQEGGPQFDVTSNFRVIKRYNPSDAYALGVGHLADRIGGAGPLRGSFPPDENGLTRRDRIALQERLTARGFDTQGADGVIGSNTEAAIRAYQASRGLPETGTPSRALLQALR
ncbi:MAG: lytic murein transglycosylase [Rhodobacter sp.]|nr:lytic murein transglycosylase [Paracoccaceae bacterium]MCC0076289.1 lytic murein transglycosylase [Rhodobacter sp.]